MTDKPPNYEPLAALIIGIGHLPNRQGRWLHMRDEEHRHHGDILAIHSKEIMQAFVLGNYRNFAAEGSTEFNNSAEGLNFINGAKDNFGIMYRFTDARRQATIEAIRNSTHGNDVANISSQHYSLFLSLIHNSGSHKNADDQRAFIRDSLGPNARGQDIETILATYNKAKPIILAKTFDYKLNADSAANIDTFFGDDSARAQYNTAIQYGAGHMDGSIQNMPDLDGVDNRGGAFPGLSISYIGQDSPFAPTEAQLLERIQINPRNGKAKVLDAPDFIVLQSTGQIIENRPLDRRVPSLAQLLESGRTIRMQAEAPVIATALTEPTQTANTAPKPVAAKSEEESKDEGFKLENMPWWHIAGAALGAWFASGIGNGIWNIIAMAIGGFLGTSLFGSIGNNIAENEENKTANAQNAQTDSTVRSLNELAISKTAASSLAFAKVNSVLPVAEADRGALLDSPVLERTQAVSSLAIN